MKFLLSCTTTTAMLLAACSSGAQPDTGGMASAAPDTATCADAPQLKERAAGERRRSAGASSDQARLVLAGRANFLASLAVIADLRCVTTDDAAIGALQTALQAARTADGTAGFYAQASQWAEANFAATRTIEILVQRSTATIEE